MSPWDSGSAISLPAPSPSPFANMHSDLFPLTTADALSRGPVAVVKHAHDLLATDGSQRAVIDALGRYAEMFLQLPVPVLVTDTSPMLLECNRAAGNLFKRDIGRLTRKPLSALLHVAAREQFRREALHLRTIEGATRVGLVLHPRGEMPVRAMATVGPFRESTPNAAPLLLWVFDPITSG